MYSQSGRQLGRAVPDDQATDRGLHERAERRPAL